MKLLDSQAPWSAAYQARAANSEDMVVGGIDSRPHFYRTPRISIILSNNLNRRSSSAISNYVKQNIETTDDDMNGQ